VHGQFMPNFFVVGAPKCATGAICAALEQHPDVYIPALREPNYFSHDLSHPDPMDEKTYLALFEGRVEARLGEGSTWYLYSSAAPKLIHQVCGGDVKIIVSLRRPLDLVVSLFEYRKFYGTHPFDTIEEGLAAEKAHLAAVDRDPIKPDPYKIICDVARYHDGLRRYIDLFGRENVKVILYEDFSTRFDAVTAELLEFLELAPMALVNNVTNPSHSRRSQRLARFLSWRPAPLQAAINRFPVGPRRALLDRINTLNTGKAKRPSLSPETRAAIEDHVRDDVTAVAALIDRDLSHWLDLRNS